MKTRYHLLNPQFGHESAESQRIAQRYNPARVFYYRKRAYNLSAGSGDSVTVWSQPAGKRETYLYILSTCERIGYAGLEIQTASDGCVYGDMFSQNVTEEIDPKFFDLSSASQRKILAQYIT